MCQVSNHLRSIDSSTHMDNWNDESALVKVLINAFDMGQNWLFVEAEIVAVEPINESHAAIVGRRVLIVVYSIHKWTRIRHHDSSQRFSQIQLVEAFGQLRSVPEEQIQTQSMSEIPPVNLTKFH